MRSYRNWLAAGSLALVSCTPAKDDGVSGNPLIDARFPIVVTAETAVEILGSDFGEEGIVRLGDQLAEILSWSAERIIIRAPESATNACTTLQVVSGKNESNTIPFGYGKSNLWVPEHAFGPEQLDAQAVWTGRELIGRGFRFRPKHDTWLPISATFPTLPIPEYEPNSRIVFWTGTKVLEWLGSTGAMFDPETNTWEPLPTQGAPQSVFGQASMWGGDALLVYGGLETCGNEQRCASPPTTAIFSVGAWQTLPLVPEEYRRVSPAIVWTGSEFLVWGGFRYGEPATYNIPMNGGIAFNPVSRQWRVVEAKAPTEGFIASRVFWLNGRLLVLGALNHYVYRGHQAWILDLDSGEWEKIDDEKHIDRQSQVMVVGDKIVVTNTTERGALFPSGQEVRGIDTVPSLTSIAIYSLSQGTWESPKMPEDIARSGSVFFTDGFGVYLLSGAPKRGGARYDLTEKLWTRLGSNEDEPPLRPGGLSAWTGSELLVYGGGSRNGMTREGARYNPATDTWTSIDENRTVGFGASAVWTGSKLFVWGGFDGAGHGWNSYGSDVSTGALYDPRTNAWTPVELMGAPTARTGASIVSTGDGVVIWGGVHTVTYTTVTTGATVSGTNTYALQDGASYDLATGTWTILPAAGAPDPANLNWTVWTGKEMLVIGRENGPTGMGPAAAAFNPQTRKWRTIAALPAHDYPYGSAHWLADRVLVVSNGTVPLMDYSPDEDKWRPIPPQDKNLSFADSFPVPAGNRLFVFPRWWSVESNNHGFVVDPSTGDSEGIPAPCGFFSALGQFGHFVWTGDRILGWGDGGVSWYIP